MDVYDMGAGLLAYNVFRTTITPQKRVSYIWWNYEATIYANIYARLDYEDASYNWTHYDVYLIVDGEVSDKLKIRGVYYEPEYQNQDYHFGGYDGEAWTNHTTSSIKAELSENTNIIDYNTNNIWSE